jgi:hypothetical protein
MVFLGTVTEILASPDRDVKRLRMRVDRVYKGVSEPTLVLFDDGMCDGPDLRLGEQYLMYTRRDGEGQVPFRGCTRSRFVEYAEEDLKYLDSLDQLAPTASVFGQVMVEPGGPGGNIPLPGAVVEIRGAEQTLTTTSDEKGHYSFSSLEPAEYIVKASHPGFRTPPFDRKGIPVRVQARGCAVVNPLLRKRWPGSIEGHLLRSDGRRAPAGIDVGLIRVGGRTQAKNPERFSRKTWRPMSTANTPFGGSRPGDTRSSSTAAAFRARKSPIRPSTGRMQARRKRPPRSRWATPLSRAAVTFTCLRKSRPR